MLSEEVRTRLARLHRHPPSWTAPPHLDNPLQTRAPKSAAPAADNAADLFSKAEECENASGRHLRFRQALGDLWPGACQPGAHRLQHGACDTSRQLHAELAAVAEHFPQGTLFLDLETCGFAGSPIFLAGLIGYAAGALVVDQLFARDYAEERALLETLWQIAADHEVLVTFNGKSFDWPMVHDRSTRHHLGRDARGGERPSGQAPSALQTLSRRDPRPELAHCDLLHHARRRWKRVLPNCKLQTLERAICRRYRQNDLGGAQVPTAYHDFVRSGDAWQLGGILRHNALDLVTLVQITLELLAPAWL